MPAPSRRANSKAGASECRDLDRKAGHPPSRNRQARCDADSGYATLGARPSNGRGRVASATGPSARRPDERGREASEEGQRSERPRAAATPRAQGIAGDLFVAPSSAESQLQPPRRASSSPRNPDARDPSHYSDGLLVLSGQLMLETRGEVEDPENEHRRDRDDDC